MRKLRVTIGIVLIILSELGAGFAGANEFQKQSTLGNQEGEYGFIEFENKALKYQSYENRQKNYHMGNGRKLSVMNFRGLKMGLSYPENASDVNGLWLNEFATGGNDSLFDRFSLERSKSFSLSFSQQMTISKIEENDISLGKTGYFPIRSNVPQAPDDRLKSALSRYQSITEKGGWSIVPAGPLMKKDDRGRRVEILRSRLISVDQVGYSIVKDSELFDDNLEKAVRSFQRRHGLKADGIVGPNTLAALNVPVEERLRQIRINM